MPSPSSQEDSSKTPPGPPPLPKRPPSALPPPPPEETELPPEPPPPPPAAELAEARPADMSKAQRLQLFSDKARFILAEQRGVTAKSQMMLARAASELELSEKEAERAIAALQQTQGDITAPPVAAPPTDSRWRMDDPPPDVQGAETPYELFRAYVDEALAKSSKHVVSRRRERRLIAEGKRKLGLSAVFARQIVHQVAADSGKTIVSLEEDEQGSADSNDAAENPNVDEFLERAAAILAEQRGINARSRVLLAAAAGELGLSDEQTDQAIASLQTSVSSDDKHDVWQQERIDSFRDYLGEVFAGLPHKVATSRMERSWIEQGQLRHGVDEGQARQVVRDLASEQDVRIVSEEQAKDHVVGVVEQLLGDATRMDGPTRARVFSEGTQWGLVPMQVDVIIREQVRANRRRRSSERGLTGLALTVGIGVLCAVLCFLAWVFFLGGRETPEPGAITEKPIVRAHVTPEAAAIESPTGEEWWAKNKNLLIAVTRMRNVLPNMKGHLVGLNLKAPEARSRSYPEMVRAAAANADEDEQQALLGALIAGCYVAEPSDECAKVIRETLLGLAPAVGDALPEDDAGYENAFWVIRTALSALTDDSLDAVRADELGRAMDQAIGTTVDRTLELPQLERQCLAALCHHLYQVIIRSAAAQPLVARPLYRAVTFHAMRYLERGVIEKMNVDLLAAVLPDVGEAWREYENLIQWTINSTDPLIVLRVVELYEEVADSSLRDFLADRLLRRAGVFPASLEVDEVARRVREAMGAKHVVTGRHRWKQLADLAPITLAERDVPVDQTELMLQQVVDLAHASTMACALAQGEVGYASFDKLKQDGPPKLAAAGNAAGAPRRPRRHATGAAADAHLQKVNRYISYLADQRQAPTHRPLYLRYIASLAPQSPELNHEPAEKLARYLLKAKTDGEHKLVLEHAETVTLWRNVRLALADQVLETRLHEERIQELFSRVIGRNLELNGDDWKQQASEAMIRDVIDDLSVAESRQVGAGRVYDVASMALRDLYTTQARLLGVLPEQYDAAESPAQVLRLMIGRYAAKLGDGNLPDEPRRHVTSLPHQFEAVEYMGANDLERTVLLQKLWLRTLALGTAHSHSAKAEQTTILVDDLEQADGNADNMFAQLRNGERAILQEWLLASPLE